MCPSELLSTSLSDCGSLTIPVRTPFAAAVFTYAGGRRREGGREEGGGGRAGRGGMEGEGSRGRGRGEEEWRDGRGREVFTTP